MAEPLVEAVLRRDRIVLAVALLAITALAWFYVLYLVADMQAPGMDMRGMRMVPAGVGWMMPASAPWGGLEMLLVFLMWTVMMIGMMTPSAAPMVLIYARVGRQAALRQQPFAAAGFVLAGYLLVWIGFSLLATAAQWAAERATLLSPAMSLSGARVGGALLVLAGLYQWSSIKRSCLHHCSSPLAFLQQHGGFRGDARGALRLGLAHGVYCVGCCWTLMVLLFVGGIMNIVWIAALAALALLERAVPQGLLIARLAGVALAVAGTALLLDPQPHLLRQ